MNTKQIKLKKLKLPNKKRWNYYYDKIKTKLVINVDFTQPVKIQKKV